MEKIIEVTDLTIDFEVESGQLRACDHVSIDIYQNEIIAIIGESGSGKSTLASGILNLVRSPGRISSGSVMYFGGSKPQDILKMNTKEENKFRWEEVSTVFQAAQNALNPVLTIKEHFLETALAHDRHADQNEILKKAEEILSYVRLMPSILDYYPHQLSGGMKQRVLIALSLILNPKVILLDEPTTALDVITQHYILHLLSDIQKKLNITMIFLTHDIAVVSGIVDRLAVMYAGEIVDIGAVNDVLQRPAHPYTRGLVDAIPTLKDDVTERKAILGNPPDLTNHFKKCKFASRCFVYKNRQCEGNKKKTEELYNVPDGQLTRCYTWAGELLGNDAKGEAKEK